MEDDMITQEDIDAMEDGMGLVDRLRKMDGDTAVMDAAADRIQQLERELSQCRSDRAEWMQAIEQANKNGQQYEALLAELAAEKALADRLYRAYSAVNDALGCQHSVSLAAYRKARGL